MLCEILLARQQYLTLPHNQGFPKTCCSLLCIYSMPFSQIRKAPSTNMAFVWFSQLRYTLAIVTVVSGRETHMSKNSFQRIENSSPCSPLQMMRVVNPRPRRPIIPSSETIVLAASAMRCLSNGDTLWGPYEHSQYEILVSFTWRYVLTTRKELDTVSDITEATKPIKASRPSHSSRFAFDGSSKTSLKKLYCCN
jgi:hypothetical protein